MDTVTRFPKGHRVICAFALTYRDAIKEKGVSFTEDDEKIFVECFVTGDSPENGLSIVALDDVKWCLHHSAEGETAPLVRECVAQGYYPYWVVHEKKHMYRRYNGPAIGSPSCPY